MANFPTKGAGGLSQGESPSLYDIDTMSNELKADADGGYEFRRPRTTRARRRIITTGFIDIPHADYLVLDAFWEAHETSTIFTYYDYVHGKNRQVRFDEFKPDAHIIGQNRMWKIKIKLSEV